MEKLFVRPLGEVDIGFSLKGGNMPKRKDTKIDISRQCCILLLQKIHFPCFWYRTVIKTRQLKTDKIN